MCRFHRCIRAWDYSRGNVHLMLIIRISKRYQVYDIVYILCNMQMGTHLELIAKKRAYFKLISQEEREQN